MKNFIVKVFAILALPFSFTNCSVNEAEIPEWKPIDKNTVRKEDFTLQGQSINYKNERPYILYLKQENGKSVWYAEMQDTGDWYITEIGQ